MQEYPETAAYRRGYAACRAELEGQVTAWLEANGKKLEAYEAMLGACQQAWGYIRAELLFMSRVANDSEMLKVLDTAIAQAKKGEACTEWK